MTHPAEARGSARSLCETCDHPVAVTADYERCRGGCACDICASLCWGPPCFDAVDWRTRAKAHEAKAALADDLYRIWRGHESQCRQTQYLEHWMQRYEAIK